MIPAIPIAPSPNAQTPRLAGARIGTDAHRTHRLHAIARAIPPASKEGSRPKGAPAPLPGTAPPSPRGNNAEHRRNAEAAARHPIPSGHAPAYRTQDAPGPIREGSDLPSKGTSNGITVGRRVSSTQKKAEAVKAHPRIPPIVRTGSTPTASPSKARPPAVPAVMRKQQDIPAPITEPITA